MQFAYRNTYKNIIVQQSLVEIVLSPQVALVSAIIFRNMFYFWEKWLIADQVLH